MAIKELLSHPLVLESAWERVKSWYKTGEFAPEPEFSNWTLNPDYHIEKLRKKLFKGEYKPSDFNLIPYPKKGAILRHYTMPSVSDQVVFAFYMILLAPILESQMSPFSFGNRWYKGIFRDRKEEPPKWIERCFSIHDKFFYKPYRRSHGLFRRVCHWTAASLLGQELPKHSSSINPDDYPKKTLPRFVSSSYWSIRTDKGYWVKLDVQLAFPSVELEYLKVVLKDMVCNYFKNEEKECHKLYQGYPWEIQNILNNKNVCLELVSQLVTMLMNVKYPESEIDELWKPVHCSQKLPGDHKHTGLPTGLAISPFLLNVYLSKLDKDIEEWMSLDHIKGQAAFLRFADDMVLLTNKPNILFEGIDFVWNSLEEKVGSNKQYSSNFNIKLSKIKPDHLKEIIILYLKKKEKESFKECKKSKKCKISKKNEGCKECEVLERTSNTQINIDIKKWWENEIKDKDKEAHIKKIDFYAIKSGRLKPFVTHLVERMSEIGFDTLLDRFEDGARNRLRELHELIRFDIDDSQVRTDTRLAFAVNRLARAWLPEGDDDENWKNLEDIRQSIQEAVNQVPWKFKIWRAVVRIAARRPINGEEFSHLHANNWIKKMLGYISVGGEWDKEWPEEINQKCREIGQVRCKGLLLSFLRANFWNVLAETIKDLKRVKNQLCRESNASAVINWSSTSWTFRAFSEKTLEQSCDWLCELDRWAKILYPDKQYKLKKWEVSFLVKAVLAASDMKNIIKGINKFYNNKIPVKHDDDKLLVPDYLDSFRNTPIVRGLLNDSKENVLCNRRKNNTDNVNIGALILMSYENDDMEIEFGKVLSEYLKNNKLSLSSFFNLNILKYFPRKKFELIADTYFDVKNIGKYFNGNFNKHELNDYFYFRKIYLGLGKNIPMNWNVANKNKPTIHRLLWGNAWSSQDINNWNIEMWAMPSLNLPIRVALYFLYEGIVESFKNASGENKNKLPIWKLCEDKYKLLTWGRRYQLGINKIHLQNKINDIKPDSSWIKIAYNNDWEILPHPAYFYPFLAQNKKYREKKYNDKFNLLLKIWCNVLHFLIAAGGSENILDTIFLNGPGVIPFEERWNWRSIIPIPPTIWKKLNKIIRFGMGFYNLKDFEITSVENLIEDLGEIVNSSDLINDFIWERVDTKLELDNDLETPQVVHAFPENILKRPEQLELMCLNGFDLKSNIGVRIGQIQSCVDKKHYFNSFPYITRNKTQAIMHQVWSVIVAEDVNINKKNTEIELTILPELTVPRNEIRIIKELVSKTKRAVLAGLLWGLLQPPVKAHYSLNVPNRYIINEALLSFPLFVADDKVSPIVRNFFIRKPRPAHLERGLAQALSTNGTIFHMLPGNRFYRFIEKNWGDFTVAICSDIIDPTPWHSMRGNLLHLFMCAFNKDIELFQALTWVRAYENYVNVVSTNHGFYGGSFAWTPKHGTEKEIASLKGKNMFLSADIVLPVKDLYNHQIYGVNNAIKNEAAKWRSTCRDDNNYKAPPPDYPGRKKMDQE